MSVPKFVKYINLSIANDRLGDADNLPELIPAVIDEQFEKAVIKNANKYSICIERMEISSTAIPMYPPTPADPAAMETYTWRYNANVGIGKNHDNLYTQDVNRFGIAIGEMDDINQIPLVAGIALLLPRTLAIGDVYSVSELLAKINEFGGDDLNVVLGADTRVKMVVTKAPRFAVVLGSDLANLLGLPKVLLMAPGEVAIGRRFGQDNNKAFKGEYSIFDRYIRARNIMIESDLPIESDVLGSGLANIMTDFRIPSSYSISSDVARPEENTLSISPPQAIVYEPKIRRFLDFLSPIELSRMRIQAYYQSYDGAVHEWELAPGGFWAIKFGLYLK